MGLLTRQRTKRLVGRIEFDAKMGLQGVKIRLAFRKLLLLLHVRCDCSERTVEQRDSPVGARERRYTSKGEKRAGMGRVTVSTAS